jgi:hypothetical protein
MRTDFDEAIGLVPPSTIDLDRLIARRRRRAAFRRAGAAGATGGVAAVALGAVIAFGGAPGGRLGAAGPGPATSPSPPVPAGPSSAAARGPSSAGARPSSEPATPPAQARQTEDRLSQAVTDSVREHAPGYSLSASLDGAPPFRFRYLYAPVTSTNSGSNWYYGSADLNGPAGTGNVWLTIGRYGSVWNPPTTCETGETDCQVTTGPQGERVLRRVINENGIRDYYVVVVRPDQTAVLIVAANQRGQLDTGAPHQPDPVLTVDQLVGIGSDPRLHI